MCSPKIIANNLRQVLKLLNRIVARWEYHRIRRMTCLINCIMIDYDEGLRSGSPAEGELPWRRQKADFHRLRIILVLISLILFTLVP